MLVRVKREGGRGHHLIDDAKYNADPSAFVRCDEDGNSIEAAKTGASDDAGGDELQAARAEYETVLGKKPFHGWDAAALREKIEAAKTGG